MVNCNPAVLFLAILNCTMNVHCFLHTFPHYHRLHSTPFTSWLTSAAGQLHTTVSTLLMTALFLQQKDTQCLASESFNLVSQSPSIY